jgi:hypothetical protein
VASVGRLLEPSLPRPRSVTVRTLGADSEPRPVPAVSISRVAAERAQGVQVVTAQGNGAAGVAAVQRKLYPAGRHRGLMSAPCQEPRTDWWLTGLEGAIGYDDTLLVSNPGTTTANVTVTAWSARGRLDPPRLQALTLEPGRSLRLAVGDYAPDEAHVTFHVRATSGRVTAIAVDSRFDGVTAGGLDFVAATRPPSDHVVVPGLPGGEGLRRLVVTNPGSADATVALRIVRSDGNFAPAARPSVVVRAGRSTIVDLTEAFDGIPGSISMSSDVPVVAAAVTTLVSSRPRTRPEIQWTPAAAALDGPAVLADNYPPFGQNARVYLCAPAGAAVVRVTARDGKAVNVRVPAGRTAVMVPIDAFGPEVGFGPLVLTRVSGEVYVARTLYAAGAHGPLVTSTQPVPVAPPVVLPPVVSDGRAATG